MKNRKRETCTSGSVRDEDGNILIYSAAARPLDGAFVTHFGHLDRREAPKFNRPVLRSPNG